MSTISATEADLMVGDKVKPVEVPGFTAESLGLGEFVRPAISDGRIICRFDRVGELQVNKWELAECADATPTEQRDNEIERQAARIRELEATSTSQLLRISNLIKALEIVNERLNEEAINRGWCSEYDEILDQVNQRISNEANGVFMLEGNTQEYEVLVEGEATVSWTYTVTVEAKNEDEAIRMVEESPTDFFDMDEAAESEVSYGSGWYTNDVNEVRIA